MTPELKLKAGAKSIPITTPDQKLSAQAGQANFWGFHAFEEVALLLGEDRSETLRPERGSPASAAFCPVPKTSLLKMKRQINGPFPSVCSLTPRVLREVAHRRRPGQSEVASGAERPCFEFVEPCESFGGKYPTAPSRSGCNPRVPRAGSLSSYECCQAMG